jgi:hypothetical protein
MHAIVAEAQTVRQVLLSPLIARKIVSQPLKPGYSQTFTKRLKRYPCATGNAGILPAPGGAAN